MENLTQYLHLRDKRKEMKRQYVRKVEVKVRRSKQQKKTREEVLRERTDKSYGPGVGLMAGMQEKRTTNELEGRGGESRKKARRDAKGCKCGSLSHQRSTHRLCPLNPRAPQAPEKQQPNSDNQPHLIRPLQPTPTTAQPTPLSKSLGPPPPRAPLAPGGGQQPNTDNQPHLIRQLQPTLICPLLPTPLRKRPSQNNERSDNR